MGGLSHIVENKKWFETTNQMSSWNNYTLFLQLKYHILS